MRADAGRPDPTVRWSGGLSLRPHSPADYRLVNTDTRPDQASYQHPHKARLDSQSQSDPDQPSPVSPLALGERVGSAVCSVVLWWIYVTALVD